jgi:preprotein translocase subunit YajC
MTASIATTLFPLVLALQETPAATEEAAQPGMNPLFLVLMMVGIFYFVVFMPERKARKRQKELLDSLGKGDKVMTTSGLLGTIVQVLDDVVVLQVDDGVRLKFTRAAIQTKLEAPEGGEKNKDGKSDKAEEPAELAKK